MIGLAIIPSWSHLCFPFETLLHYWQYLLHTTSKNYPYSLTTGFGFVICVGYWPELGLLLMYRDFHHSDAGSKSCNLISSNKLLLASKQSISFSFLFPLPLLLLVWLMAFPLSHLPRKKTCLPPAQGHNFYTLRLIPIHTPLPSWGPGNLFLQRASLSYIFPFQNDSFLLLHKHAWVSHSLNK